MKFAQILNNKVHWIGEYDKTPHFHSSVGQFINIDNKTLQPQEGWLYDSETKAFSEPSVVPSETVTTISNIDIWDRFTETEKENLVSSTSKKVKRFLYELKIRSSLEVTKLRNVIHQIETAGIIETGRADEIMDIKEK